MKIQMTNPEVGGYRTISIINGDRTLDFTAAFYNRIFNKGLYDPFNELNEYWERLDKETLDNLFSLYENSKEVLNESMRISDLIVRLRPVIDAIVNIHNTDRFDNFVRFHSDVWIPMDLTNEYLFDHERPGTREQTYLISDYWNLVVLSVKLRALTPIISEYLEKTKLESGTTFLNLNAYYLLTKSPIINEPALDKLNQYIDKNSKQVTVHTRSTLDGIGSEYFLTSILANIIIKVLCVADLCQGGENSHLVQLVHKEIRNKLSQLNSYQNEVKDKNHNDIKMDSDDSTSIVENYKNKPLVAPGDFSAMEIWTTHMDEILAKLYCQDLLTDEQYKSLMDEYDYVHNTIDHPFEDCQINLIRWVVNPIFSPRAMWDINRASIVRLSVIAQEWLFNCGFKEIALLTTAKSLHADEYGSSNGMFKVNISKTSMEELNELYPYYRKFPNKKNFKQVNDVVLEIESIDKDLSNHTWSLCASDEKVKELTRDSLNKIYRTSNNLKTRLVDLAIALQKRNKNFVNSFKL